MFRSIYIFLLLFPFLVVPFDHYINLVKMGLLAYLCLSIWIFLFLKSYKRRTLLTKKQLTYPEIALFMLAIWAAISTILSKHPYVSVFGSVLRQEGILALYSYFTVFVIAVRFAEAEKMEAWLTWLVYGSIVAGIYGILQKFPFLPFIHGSGRVMSFFGNPDFYGSYLVIVLFLAVTLTMTATVRKKKVLFFTAANLLFLNLLFSGTRSALVGIFIGLIFFSPFLWSKFPLLRKRYAGLLISFVLVFGFVNLFESNSYLHRVFSIVADAGKAMQNNSGDAGSGRWKLWEIALPLVAKYPIFGSGPDTLRYVYDQAAFREYIHDPSIVVDKAHNEYLQIAITMGTPALIFYLVFLGFVFHRMWRAIWQRSGEKQLQLAGLFALLLGYAAQAIFNISVVPVAPFFWLMLGLGYRMALSFTPKN